MPEMLPPWIFSALTKASSVSMISSSTSRRTMYPASVLNERILITSQAIVPGVNNPRQFWAANGKGTFSGEKRENQFEPFLSAAT